MRARGELNRLHRPVAQVDHAPADAAPTAIVAYDRGVATSGAADYWFFCTGADKLAAGARRQTRAALLFCDIPLFCTSTCRRASWQEFPACVPTARGAGWGDGAALGAGDADRGEP
jgi:hypothetical protein